MERDYIRDRTLEGSIGRAYGDKKLIKACRGPHNHLGYALQLTTVRYLGRFLADPLDGVPTKVLDYLAEQLGILTRRV